MRVNLQTRNVTTNDRELNIVLGQGIPPLFSSYCPNHMSLNPLTFTLLSPLLSLAPTSSPSLLWLPHLVKPQMAGQHGATRVICLTFQRGEGQGRSRGSQDDGHVLGDHQLWGQAGQARCTSVPVTYFPYYFPPATDCPPQEAEHIVVRPGIAKDQTKLPGE